MIINLYNKITSIVNKTFIIHFIKYCFIGVINVVVSFVAFYLLHLLLKKQSISLFLATLVGIICSYLLNSRFNFKTKTSKKKYMLFVIGMLLLGYICGYIGDFWQLPLVVTIIIQVMIGTPLGFLFTKYIIFKK